MGYNTEIKYACMYSSWFLLLLHFLVALYKHLDCNHMFTTVLTTVTPNNNKGSTAFHLSVSALSMKKKTSNRMSF